VHFIEHIRALPSTNLPITNEASVNEYIGKGFSGKIWLNFYVKKRGMA